MIRALSDRIYRVTNIYTVLALTALFFWFIFFFLDPTVDRIVGTGSFVVLPFFEYLIYTPDDFYTQLESYGEAGRAAFADYRKVNSTLWLITMGAFFVLLSGALLRYATPEGSWQRSLHLVALLPSLFDFLENQLQIVLVAFYPDRFDVLAALAAVFTVVKWATLMSTYLIIAYAALRALVVLVSGRKAGGSG
jgi:hypothetical protein